MTLERIFRAALSDMQSGKATPHCGSPARFDMDDPLGEIQWTHEYAEPGYDNPKRGILFANWNRYPTRLTDLLERYGYEIEWSDEWTTCESCNRAIRTSPDSYMWRKSYFDFDDGSTLCVDCVKDDLDEYESALLNNPRRADLLDIDWKERGFTKLNKDHFESGFHPGQNDNPEKIAKTVPAGMDYLFQVPSVGQFDIMFDCWTRPKDHEEG